METYEVLFKEGETTGVYGISLVNDPAMESMWVALSKEEQFQLKSVDTEKRIVCGAVLIPNKPIYRNQNGKEFNIVFPAKTIELVSQAYLENMHQKSSTLEHDIDAKINDVCVVYSWIKESDINDKSVMYGFNDPIGTWYASMKINNDEIWNDYVKTGKVKGFSIDGFFDLEQVNLKSELNMSEQKEKSFIEDFKAALSEFFTPKKTDKEEAIKLGSVNTADGTVKINFEGDTVMVDLPVSMTAPDGTELPVPDGEYNLEGGMKINVAGSIVTEVSTSEEEAKDEEQTPMNDQAALTNEQPQIKSEKVTQEVFYQLSKEDFNAMLVEFGKQVDEKVNSLRLELKANNTEVVELTKAKPAKEVEHPNPNLQKFRASKL
jgi:hypothetical protein